jgi:hypothetical protein
VILAEKRGLAVADCAGVLPNIAGGVDAGGNLGEIFGFDCAQVLGRDPGGLGNLLQSHAYPLPCGSQIEAGARRLRNLALGGGRHEQMPPSRLIGFGCRED